MNVENTYIVRIVVGSYNITHVRLRMHQEIIEVGVHTVKHPLLIFTPEHAIVYLYTCSLSGECIYHDDDAACIQPL